MARSSPTSGTTRFEKCSSSPVGGFGDDGAKDSPRRDLVARDGEGDALPPPATSSAGLRLRHQPLGGRRRPSTSACSEVKGGHVRANTPDDDNARRQPRRRWTRWTREAVLEGLEDRRQNAEALDLFTPWSRCAGWSLGRLELVWCSRGGPAREAKPSVGPGSAVQAAAGVLAARARRRHRRGATSATMLPPRRARRQARRGRGSRRVVLAVVRTAVVQRTRSDRASPREAHALDPRSLALVSAYAADEHVLGPPQLVAPAGTAAPPRPTACAGPSRRRSLGVTASLTRCCSASRRR